MAKEKHAIKVAADVAKGIAAHAKGHPATILAVGAAAGIAAIGLGLGHGANQGGRYIKNRLIGR
jgi:hypothetical protein